MILCLLTFINFCVVDDAVFLINSFEKISRQPTVQYVTTSNLRFEGENNKQNGFQFEEFP